MLGLTLMFLCGTLWATGRYLGSSIQLIGPKIEESFSPSQAGWRIKPVERLFIAFSRGVSIIDLAKNRDPGFSIKDSRPLRLREQKNSVTDGDLVRCGKNVFGQRCAGEFFVLRRWRSRYEWFATCQRIGMLLESERNSSNHGWAIPAVTKDRFRTQAVAVALSIDGRSDNERTIRKNVARGYLMKILRYADQLEIEYSQSDGCCRHNEGQKNHHARTRIATVIAAVLVGTGCLIWGLGRIGRCAWSWVICGWLLYEAAGFIWFCDRFWAWLCAWAFAA